MTPSLELVEGAGRPTVCYDYDNWRRALVKQGMTEEDTNKWMGFDTMDAYVGEHRPYYLHELCRASRRDAPVPALSSDPRRHILAVPRVGGAARVGCHRFSSDRFVFRVVIGSDAVGSNRKSLIPNSQGNSNEPSVMKRIRHPQYL